MTSPAGCLPPQPITADAGLHDTDLALAAGRRDAAACHALYVRLRPGIAAFVTRLVGTGPDRDDVTQEVFLQLYRALPRFRGDASVATFARRITMNVVVDHLRRRGRQQRLDFDSDVVEAVVDTAQDPERHSSARQQLRSLLHALDGIADTDRCALLLVAVAGLSMNDAAARMGANAGWVKQRVMRARRELTARTARGAARAPRRSDAP